MAALVSDLELSLGPNESDFEQLYAKLVADRVSGRIFDRDYTLWKPEPVEIANRLGWLDSPLEMRKEVAPLKAFKDELVSYGVSKVLLLGMGGSSLAPRVFGEVPGTNNGGLELGVLDSTAPEEVANCAARFRPDNTLYVVSSKSGGTVETLSFLKYFYNWALDELGPHRVGDHFVAITDPGSGLEKIADEHSFRRVFLNDPHMGGRYSALSHFGLVPAALLGLEVEEILQSACKMRSDCQKGELGLRLGVALGALALSGQDKVTFLGSNGVGHFSAWLEQLIAESSGKEGCGILPVVGELPGAVESYSDDRLFVRIKVGTDDSYNELLTELENQGRPVIELALDSWDELGGQFFLWEFATAVACHVLRVNPFNQPNVEAAKRLAKELLDRAKHSDRENQPKAQGPDEASLVDFVNQAAPGDYIAIQVYLPFSGDIDDLLQELRARIRDRTQAATTLGYGPRYLHSTGQLHKGDAGRGLFVQLTSDHNVDVAIPDEIESSSSSMTFGQLQDAQALGDFKALEDRGRRVFRFHLGHNRSESLQRLIDLVS